MELDINDDGIIGSFSRRRKSKGLKGSYVFGNIQGREQGGRQVDLSSTWVEINDVCVSRIPSCVYSGTSSRTYTLRTHRLRIPGRQTLCICNAP